MNGSTRRVAVLALCVVAVALAALLFPATGLDAAPSDPTGAGDAGSGPDDARGPSSPGATPTASGGTDSGGTAGSTDTTTATADRTATPGRTGTSDVTPTDRDGGPPSDEGGGALARLGTWVATLVVVGGVALVAAGEGKTRDWPVFRQLPVPAVTVAGLGQAASAASMSFLVGLSSSLPTLLAGLSAAAGATGSALSVAFAGAGRGLGAAIVSVPRAFGHALAGLSGGFGALFAGRSRTGRVARADAGRSASDAAGPTGPLDREDGAEDDPPATVEGAWIAMVERLPGGHRETKTPAELARTAVDRGFPSEPVGTLTDAFQRVSYGGAAGDELTDEALAALARIDDALKGDDE